MTRRAWRQYSLTRFPPYPASVYPPFAASADQFKTVVKIKGERGARVGRWEERYDTYQADTKNQKRGDGGGVVDVSR